MKKHIVFDVDDTLTNSYELNQKLFVDTFLFYNSKVDQNYLRELHFFNKGTSMKIQFETAIKHLNLNNSVFELIKKNEELHNENIDKMTIFDGVFELFKQLKEKDKKISICSNRGISSLNKIIDKYDLRKYLDNIVSCSDEGFEKPDPTCLLRIIEKDDFTKDAYLYFGDSKTDSEFAGNAGIDFVIIDHYLNQKKFYNLILQLL